MVHALCAGMGSAQVVEALLHGVVQRRVRQRQGDVLVPQPLVQLVDLDMPRAELGQLTACHLSSIAVEHQVHTH